MRQTINKGRVSYEPNTLGGGCPYQAGTDMSGFASFAEKLDAPKIRARGEKFFDHFSQAALFYNSQSEPEKAHIINALRFELGKVEEDSIRERMVGMLGYVDKTLATGVAQGLGISVPKVEAPLNHSIPADGVQKDFQPKPLSKPVRKSPALSMANTVKDGIETRKIAILVADGFDEAALSAMTKALKTAGGQPRIVGPRLGVLKGAEGGEVKLDFSLLTASSVLFDAVYVPGGAKSVATLKGEPDALSFISEAYSHFKPLAGTTEGVDLLSAAGVPAELQSKERGDEGSGFPDAGIVLGRDRRAGAIAADFIRAIAQHRHWDRKL
jgi:catalase